MAHSVKFDRSFSVMGSLLSEQEVRDVIDMFYRFEDTNFEITCDIPNKKPGLRGQHSYNGAIRLHRIYLSRNEIEKAVKEKSRLGGNTSAPTAKMGVVMVLTHELQHANQSILHGAGTQMHRQIPFQKYLMRPCERDARAYVDNNLEQIAAFCGVELNSAMKVRVVDIDDEELEDELEDLADVLAECETIEIRDIAEELRNSGMNNQKNITALAEMLKERGVEVVS